MMGRRIWITSLVVVLGCSAPKPGAEPDAHPAEIESSAPEIVAEGVVSTALNQTFPSLDPASGDLWFSEYERSFRAQSIFFSRAVDGEWQAPEMAPFSGQWGDRAPRFSPDGSSIFFTSNRPRPGNDESGDMNIWRVERESGGWGEPQLVESPVNSEENDIHSSTNANATWLASNREGSLGRSDLYRIGADGSLTHLPPPVNDENSQSDLWMSPDESWMILAITDHPDGFGGDDLYVSRRTGDTWSTPVNLGPEINTAEYEYGPSVSPDGRHLYFTSHRDGPAHVYRIPIGMIPAG